ncbi:MAG: serine/threonine-protein kinase [Thermoguttaceae bacterium]
MTQPQGGQERRRSQEMSLNRGHPPTQVPGYDPEQFLGAGAYGEVWVAVERNTGRRVAIKFYAHRGGLDWSLLSREVEKLAFLFADRYVVQLLAVGWEAEPPYYVMEYLERGSLGERLQAGPLPVAEAVRIFRDVATGLVHSHAKGVLHCDLKPANILLDQDGKPRLADFGQSRLSHEQAPALGTMFYMAPEQADLEAMPDVRWDVYALGALLYCMLTGSPPYRTAAAVERIEKTADLKARLADYRHSIETAPRPAGHRRVKGVDRGLAEIIDRCLAVRPGERFASVHAVLTALDEHAARRARRPLMVLGAVGPAMLLAVVGWFAWRGFNAAIHELQDALVKSELEGDSFAAAHVAHAAGRELEYRYGLTEDAARSPPLHQALSESLGKPAMHDMLVRLSDPALPPNEAERLRDQFRKLPERAELQRRFARLTAAWAGPGEEHAAVSWLLCDPLGVSIARVPEGPTIGKCFAWRSYFHGGPSDREETWRPAPDEHLRRTQANVFRSQAVWQWLVGITTPIYDDAPRRKFLGVISRTTEVGRFIKFPGSRDQFAVLVDFRDGKNQGMVVQHPLLDAMVERGGVPDRFMEYRLGADDLPDTQRHEEDYVDPLAADEEGGPYRQRWLAQMKPVEVRGQDTGWLVIVQESYDAAIGTVVAGLRGKLIRNGVIALGLAGLVMVGLWLFATRVGGRWT